jgi:hypothetical protein
MNFEGSWSNDYQFGAWEGLLLLRFSDVGQPHARSQPQAQPAGVHRMVPVSQKL